MAYGVWCVVKDAMQSHVCIEVRVGKKLWTFGWADVAEDYPAPEPEGSEGLLSHLYLGTKIAQVPSQIEDSQ